MRGVVVAMLITLAGITGARAETALCKPDEDSGACLKRIVVGRCEGASFKKACEAKEATLHLPLILKWFAEAAKATGDKVSDHLRRGPGRIAGAVKLGDPKKTSDPAWRGNYCTKDTYFSRTKQDLGFDGVANFGVVEPGRLMRASQPFTDGQEGPDDKRGNGFDTLKKLGVKCRVLLRTSTRTDNLLDEKVELAKRGIKLHHFPVPSGLFGPPFASVFGVKIPDSVRAAYTKALEKARDNFMKVMDDASNGLCYLSCQSGKDRTGVLVGWYRAVKQGWKPKRIFEEQDDCKFEARGHFKYYRRTFCRWYKAKFGADPDCDRVLAGAR